MWSRVKEKNVYIKQSLDDPDGGINSKNWKNLYKYVRTPQGANATVNKQDPQLRNSNYRKGPNGNLESQIIISTMEKWLDSLNSILDTVEDRASELIDKSLENIQSEEKLKCF